MKLEHSGTRTLIIHPELPPEKGCMPDLRAPEALLAEAVSLSEAIELLVMDSGILNVRKPHPATLFGKGQVENIAASVAALEIDLVFINAALSPIQQRNLERDLKTKVIDRTGLILEIFGARAKTREGQMQVELAALSFQRTRLVRSWTHLERQRGGYGFLGGPGESQLEIDRRLIEQRILRLRKDIAHLRQTRSLNRAARQKNEIPVVALVGYTNAGKSTLFNWLTGASVMAEDMLFATLDTHLKKIRLLPKGEYVILSDTVGFISNLPVQLVDAFRATLEEVQNADIILHVRDISHADTEAQRLDVVDVLGQLGIEHDDVRLIEVLNKIDLLTAAKRSVLERHMSRKPLVGISAKLEQGGERLFAAITEALLSRRHFMDVALAFSDGAALAWLHAHGHVMSRHEKRGKIHLRVALTPPDMGRFLQRFPDIKVVS